ncbi:MAG: PDZ domain-containing protein [Planctomycetota bacterium]|jgi:S1-C subfamily serine protease
MKLALTLAAAATGIFACTADLTDGPAIPPQVDMPAQVAEVTDDAPAVNQATEFLLDVNNGGDYAPQLMQMGGTLPKGWTPDDPIDLSGDMPADADVRAAIRKAVNHLLSQQGEDGRWDVVLEGSLLSNTADQAVDAIAATSLAGIALRYHMAVDPEKLATATRKAADFIIDRVYRGKLPLGVQYANWRYNLGLKFLHMEYLATEDDERQSEIRSVCRRMVQAMMKLQLSNSEASTLDKKRRKKVSSRFKGMDQPAALGVVLELPSDENYRGGAPIAEIIEGSTADKQGFKVGDRIVEAEGLRVENAVDYYMMEPGWVAGQRVRIKLRRDGAKDTSKDIQLAPSWPAFLGVKGTNVSDGVQVTGFYPFSPCKGELEIGDIIFDINKTPVAKMEDLAQCEAGMEMGDKVKVSVYRGEKRKKKSERIEVGAAPEGWTGILPTSEDKGDENGVLVRDDPAPGTMAAELGIKKDDRVTRIGTLPLLGFDHFVEAYLTIPAGRTIKVTWLRDGEEMSGEGMPTPLIQPGDLQLKWANNMRNMMDVYRNPARVKSVDKGGVAEKAGIKANDTVSAINGNATPSFAHAYRMLQNVPAGEEIEITVKRKNKEIVIKVELAKQKQTADVGNEEGGWAYYPSMKESPSFCTATGIMALMDIESDLDIKGLRSALKEPLMAAARLVNKLRAPDSSQLTGKAEAYAYRAGSINPKKRAVDLRGSQGRNAACEMALVRFGKSVDGSRRTKSHLKSIVDQFIDHRGQLDAVRRMEFYAPPRKRGSPHNYDRWNNAAYYWMFGHYHTIQAAKIVGKKHYKKMNEICVKSLMHTRQDDGTWLGHPAFGKICGTSLALWILGETEGGWKGGYEEVTTQPGKDKPETPETPGPSK